MTTKKYTITEKLSLIQRKLKAPKGQYNKFGNFYYRSCEDILEEVKPLLMGCSLKITDKIVKIGERYYLKATAVLFDNTDKISVSAYAREADSKKGMDSAQVTGASSSYARKYALNGLFLIDDTKDADTKDNTDDKDPKWISEGDQKTEEKVIEKKKTFDGLASPAQHGLIFKLMQEEGLTGDEAKNAVKTRFKLESFNDLQKNQASEFIDMLLKNKDKEQPQTTRSGGK